MSVGFAHLQPIVSLIAGILILITPQLLNGDLSARLRDLGPGADQMTQSLKAANETPRLLTVRGQRPISPEMLEMGTPLSNFMGGITSLQSF